MVGIEELRRSRNRSSSSDVFTDLPFGGGGGGSLPVIPPVAVKDEWMQFSLNGPVVVAAPADGENAFGFTGDIFSIAVERRVAGSGGTTTVDILKNGASILSNPVVFTPADGSNVVKLGSVSNGSFSTTDRFRMDITSAESGTPQDVRARVNSTRTGP